MKEERTALSVSQEREGGMVRGVKLKKLAPFTMRRVGGES